MRITVIYYVLYKHITVWREIFVGANFRIIDQNTLRINFRSFKFRMIYCTRARACRRFANIPRADEKITPMQLLREVPSRRLGAV